MKAKACACAFLLLSASAAAAPCYTDGDVVTREGTAVRQPTRMTDAGSKPAWVLSLSSPICVDSPTAPQGQRQSSVTQVQIIDTIPTENERIQLTGKLVTGNMSAYYAVPTAIWVLRERPAPSR
jgi:hypothetical protein